MLVLSRKEDEEIVIDVGGGELIVIKLVELKGDRVRFGIKASSKFLIHRREVYDVIQAEKKSQAEHMTAVKDILQSRSQSPQHQCTSSCPPPIKRAPPVKNTRDAKPPKSSFRSPPSSSAVAAA